MVAGCKEKRALLYFVVAAVLASLLQCFGHICSKNKVSMAMITNFLKNWRMQSGLFTLNSINRVRRVKLAVIKKCTQHDVTYF